MHAAWSSAFVAIVAGRERRETGHGHLPLYCSCDLLKRMVH